MKLKLLVMTVLLSCSINSLGSNNKCDNPSTGELVEDSVKISYNDLREANSKLIQLDFEIQKNNKLYTLFANDSIIKEELKANIAKEVNKNATLVKKNKVYKYTAIGGVVVGIAGVLIGALK